MSQRMSEFSSFSRPNNTPLHVHIILFFLICSSWLGFPGVSVIKKLPAKRETEIQSLGQEDPLEGQMATLSSILAWRIP